MQRLIPSDKEILSTGELATICGVTRHTIITAIDHKQLHASRTPGGHNRIMREDAIVFMKKYDYLPESYASKCILIIDEDDFIYSLMQQLYGESNTLILHATSGYEAGKLAERNRPRLIVFNLMFRNFDENEICVHITEEEYSNECRVLAITEKLAPDETDLIKKSGIQEHIVKPFTIYELKEKVDRLLDLKIVAGT